MKLTGSSANFGAFAAVSSDFDIIHLACHGRFRPDNPLFSSLTLADGQVTVRDLCESRIRASVVTLSACETGLSAVAAGEEILGLSGGFLSAGAGNLVLSLSLDAGKAIYEKNCVACHAANGGGGVGPNFTDNYWLHGNSINDLFKVIKYGVPEKGMIPWESQLNPEQMQQFASFILKEFAGKNVEGGKEPQGDEIK